MRSGRAEWHYFVGVNPAELKSKASPSIGRGSENVLTEEQLRDARLGFEWLLRSKNFPRGFVAKHGEDLMQRAAFELARKAERGEKITNPPGLLITIAYRRAQNLAEKRERAPDFVGLGAVAEVADEEGSTPEETTLERDRVAKLHAAVRRLTVEERQIVALRHFEALNLSEAARRLDWDESKARRRYAAAMDHLKDLLGVDSSDQVVIDVGFCCWMTFAFGQRVGFNLAREVESVWQRLEDVLIPSSERAQHLAHKANGQLSSDPATASAVGNFGRAAKLCGAAALCALGAGAGVIIAGGGADPGSPPARHPARSRPAPANFSKPAPLDSKATVAGPPAAAAASAPALPRAQGKKTQAAKPVGSEPEPEPNLQPVTPAHASQPPPAEALAPIEENNRPEGGPQVPHPAQGPEGSSIGGAAEAGGKTPPEEEGPFAGRP